MDVIKELNDIWQKKMTRRGFLKACVTAGVGLSASSFLFKTLNKYEAYAAIGEKRGMHEALFYEKMGDAGVRCLLCPNKCVLADGQRGFCRVREPVGGKLYTLVYELVCSSHVDPIEKKPLFHFLPASKAFSVATAGCNSRCKFCQNWTISQRPPEELLNERLSVKDLSGNARYYGCGTIAFTYNEPTVFYEYMYDSAVIARQNGIKNLMITGGKINTEPLEKLSPVIDAANVDLKGFNKRYLREVCAQDLDNILNTLTVMKKNGMWIEITNLIVPTMNDNMDEIRQMTRWIYDNLGADVPVHFSRFWPQYKLRGLYPTPVETLKNARDIARQNGLHYVYIGNVSELDAENTACPSCKKTVVKRKGYSVLENNVREGKCAFCGKTIAGVWG